MDQGKITQEKQDQLLFMMLVQQNQQIAMMGLGKEPNPTTQKVEKDLASAKYAIDTLNMLERYTSGNLSGEMNDYLKQTLSSLRLSYVEETQKKENDGE